MAFRNRLELNSPYKRNGVFKW